MQGLHMDRVTYCKYGFRYKKPTAIWHNLPWTPSQGPCRKGDRCEAFQGTRHPEAAQRGPTKGRQGSNSRDQLYSIPPVRLFKTPEYSVKQPPDPVVCKPPANGILCAPSASGKTVLLVSMILEQYRGCFERIYIFSPSVEVDSAWQPVKDYIRDELGVNTDREQCWWEDWDEAALRKIIADQKRITQKSKELGLKKLYQVLVVLDDHADNPAVHRKTGDGVLDTLFIRGRHFCINTWVSTQKLRLMSSAVRVNVMFYCVFRLRNQLELDALVEELSAMLPKETLYAMYEEATREPYSFWFVNLRAPKEDMFWVRFDRKFLLNGDAPEPDGGQVVGGRPRQTSDGSNASEFSARPTRFFRRRSKKGMTSIYVDSRLRAEGTDSSFSFDIGESVHIQSGAKLAVYKVRVADAFLSTDRGTFLYWEDTVAGTLHYAELPVGAYTGPRLAAWISSNFASASYTAETNELDVTYDGVRLILNDAELRQRFPGTAPYPPGASPELEVLLRPKLLHPVQGLDVGGRAGSGGVRVGSSASTPAQKVLCRHHAAVQCPCGSHECGRPACHSQAPRRCSHARSGAQCCLAKQRKRARTRCGLCSTCRFCSPRSHFCCGSEALGRLRLGHLLAHELLDVSGCRPLHLLGSLSRPLQKRLDLTWPADDLGWSYFVGRGREALGRARNA
ncbi:FV3-083R [Symbiodinium natans]|uniref:FV3-083R protein n=1 Tax=Symbiodinium natans TaxID=878477 RepID=A0A812IKC4_9DINO|nr:FV3-083R [Symbiodinium natans]